MSVYDAVKDLAAVARKIDNIELVQRVLDLQSEALKEREERQRLLERIRELDEQLTAVQGELDFAGSMRYDETINAYRVDGGTDGEGILCSKCWDVDRRAVRLHDYTNGFWGCPNCQTSISYRAGRG